MKYFKFAKATYYYLERLSDKKRIYFYDNNYNLEKNLILNEFVKNFDFTINELKILIKEIESDFNG